MKIKLISPSWLRPDGSVVRTRAGKGKILNLSFIYVAGLTPPGHELSAADEFFEELDYDEPVDLVGLTAMTSQAPRAYQIAAEYRKRGVKVAMGGFHASFCAEEAAAKVDAVVKGEAEGSWPELVRDAEAGRLKKFYQASAPAELEGLPAPRYDLVAGKRQRYIYYPLWMGRGCPMNCRFCSVAAFYGSRYRPRPVKEVLRDAEQIPGRRVFMVDDNLGAYGERLWELLPALERFKFRWLAQGDHRFGLNEKLLDLSAKAGLESAYIGFESVFSDRLRELGKNWMKLEEFRTVARNLHSRGILLAVSLMFGVGLESKETVKRTLEFLLEIQADSLALYFYVPLPGTALFQELSEKKLPFSRDWSRYHGNLPVINYEGASWENMEELYWSLYQGFYKTGATVTRHWRIPYRPVFWTTSLVRNLLILRLDVNRRRSMFYNGASYLDLLPGHSSEI